MSRIELDFGNTSVYGTLNDTETARAFLAALPMKIEVGSSGMDFCGQIGMTLPCEDEQIGFGWKDGDINYNPGGGWFAVFYAGEDSSGSYGDQVNMGKLDEGATEVLASLSGSYLLTVKEA